LLVVIVAVTGALVLAYVRRSAVSGAPSITRSVRLTNDDFGKSPELASDGPRVHFSAWKAGRGFLSQVSATGGARALLMLSDIARIEDRSDDAVRNAKRALIILRHYPCSMIEWRAALSAAGAAAMAGDNNHQKDLCAKAWLSVEA
jgi:hypothetical protein